ncbi:hypothetical protein HOY80DRAFT_1137475 [Tuber brumale]|nr:hypothetical protein HOY80DRAFT_1137475 [Tuber brumale]
MKGVFEGKEETLALPRKNYVKLSSNAKARLVLENGNDMASVDNPRLAPHLLKNLTSPLALDATATPTTTSAIWIRSNTTQSPPSALSPIEIARNTRPESVLYLPATTQWALGSKRAGGRSGDGRSREEGVNYRRQDEKEWLSLPKRVRQGKGGNEHATEDLETNGKALGKAATEAPKMSRKLVFKEASAISGGGIE